MSKGRLLSSDKEFIGLQKALSEQGLSASKAGESLRKILKFGTKYYIEKANRESRKRIVLIGRINDTYELNL